jgi:hypothetical protein
LGVVVAFHRYFALVPEEYLEGSEARLAEVEWARRGQGSDADPRYGAFVGAFDSDEAAVSQLRQAASMPSAPAIVRLPGLEIQKLVADDETAGGAFTTIQKLLDQVGEGQPVIAVAKGDQAEAPKDEPKKDEPKKDEPKKDEPKKDEPKPADGTEKPAAEVAPLAQTIEAGLKAIDVPPGFWAALSPEAQREFAESALNAMYRDRSSHARNIRWTFSQDAELLSYAPDDASRSELAVAILKTRTGLAEHQLDSAAQDVALKAKSVDYAEQGVELRRKAVEQQDAVAKMLTEFLAHLKRWRDLSIVGVVLLIVTLLFSMAIIVWLVILTKDDKLSDWGLPTAIFALALFVISPAVLLLRERPLKGLDEAGWPGTAPAKADEPQASPQSGAKSQTSGTAPSGGTSAPGVGHQ